jgi:hypothetical protein
MEAVVEWMRGLERAGTIRRHGICAGERLIEALEWLDARGLLEGAIVQAPLSDDMFRLPERFAGQELFVHSVFRSHADGAESGRQDLRGIAERLAAAGNCRAIICSMFSPAHIAANAAALA